MAKESITIQVKASEEQDTINEYQAFGWELWQSESVSRSDGERIFYYTKLIFQREKTMPNYNQLVELETQYRNIKTPPNPEIGLIISGFIASAISIYIFIAITSSIIVLFLGVGFSGIAISFIKGRIDYKKNIPVIEKKKKSILSKARNLCQ